jgi:phosphopantothenoylcysteine decarboxylase/phosphopantothenate--cysteine ligase
MPQYKSNLESTNILLGVSGGVAAYKTLDLASRLTAAGARVKTVMTENACRLVGAKSFEAVTASSVYTDMWADMEDFKISHIALVDWADMVVVAPATANIIGKAANGICDDLLSTMLCTCWNKTTLMAPAMNTNMWENPSVQVNVEKLKQIGFEIVGPATGRLACGTEGIGRMAEPQDILEAIAMKIKNKPK